MKDAGPYLDVSGSIVKLLYSLLHWSGSLKDKIWDVKCNGLAGGHESMAWHLTSYLQHRGSQIDCKWLNLLACLVEVPKVTGCGVSLKVEGRQRPRPCCHAMPHPCFHWKADRAQIIEEAWQTTGLSALKHGVSIAANVEIVILCYLVQTIIATFEFPGLPEMGATKEDHGRQLVGFSDIPWRCCSGCPGANPLPVPQPIQSFEMSYW